jgi:7,8-dihydropterin-6-yl-methyl-4-(beta-D-ribofuranosyl)aminobenzene 5'-phosphate synthase
MKARLTTLCENTAGRFGFIGEWGLSIMVEYGQERVIVDTGLTNSIVHNAHAAHVDLDSISQVVISHGHRDHTGGLRHLLNMAQGEVDVYAHPDIWGKKYSIRTGPLGEHKHFVGIQYYPEEFEYLGAVFHYSREPVWLSENMVITGKVPMTTSYESIDENLFVKTKKGFVPDSLEDDQALIVKTQKGLVVILGCAHRGMINTLIHARNITGIDKIYAVVGGTHLYHSGQDRVDRSIAELKNFGVEKIGVSHCTGMRQATSIFHAFGDRFFFNNAGTVIDL